MKSLRFLPIAFVADVHGFVVFAPYMLVLLAAAYLLRRRPAAQPVLLAMVGGVGPGHS